MSMGIIRTLFYEKTRNYGTGKNSLCLVLGAGADISSGGMTFSEVKKACVEHFSDISLPSLLSPEKIDNYFNEFFEKLVSEKQRASVMDFLFHGMESVKPSDGYKLLVLLAKAGIIDSIITTNFDTTLEAAQEELGLDVFQIYAPGVASPYVMGKNLFLPPRPLYVKLHGDIKAKRITHLTMREITEKRYDRNFSLLLQSILQTHTLIFIGYSGGDEIFARELDKASTKLLRPVYWCNITPLTGDTTFANVLQQKEIISVNAAFEDLLSEVGAYPLRNITLLESKPHFLFPLLKDRINCANEQFISLYTYKDSSTRLALLQSRQLKLDQIAAFRFNVEKPLAVLSGLSGVGKTTLLCQLYDAEATTPLPRLLLLQAKGLTSVDFAEDLVIRLGYAADNPFALLYELSAWLRKNGQQLLVVVDALNEFDWMSRRCLDLFKAILRVALWVQPHNSLKFLITMRPEMWNELYSSLDHADLRKVLWNGSEFNDDLRCLRLDRFSSKEMSEAYHSYAHHFGVTTPLRQLSEETKKLLTDPYFLSLAMKQGGSVDPDRATFQLYNHIFTDILERSFGRNKALSIDNCLLRLVSIGLNKGITDFSLEIIESIGIGHEELRVLLEIPILQKIDNAIYSFTHDRVHEYYLAKSINELSLVQIRDWGELINAVEMARSYPRLASALLQCVVHTRQSKREHYLRLIINGLKGQRLSNPNYITRDESIIDFCRDVFFTLAVEYPESFREVVDSCLDKQDIHDEKDILTRLLIRASVLLPFNLALPLFIRAKEELATEVQREASMFLYDKITEELLERSVEYIPYLTSGALHEYIFEPKIEVWQSVIRLLGITARIGRDNTHPDEWQHFYKCVSYQLDKILAGYSFPKSSESDLTEMVLQHSNTILFNAGPQVLEQFFMASSRQELREVFNEIDEGESLSLEKVINLRRYVEELDQNIEFVIMNLFFIISMKQNRVRTLQLFSDYYDTFGEQTRTEELDFFLSALCTSHLALGIPCQPIIAHYTERMMKNLPQISLSYPGAVRGERRALFNDPFEQQFEDGFNPLAFYFYNAPSELRQSLPYLDYINFAHDDRDPISLYWKFLECYEQQYNQAGIIRIVHALGQMISLWPTEGLVAAEKLVGRTEPTIRRAIVRVLTEANARFPKETSRMLSRAGSGFTENERRQIYWAKDSHMAYRALEQLHWSRVMYFLNQRDTSGRMFNKLGRALVDSFSLPEALGRIMNDIIIIPSNL
jgi:hypothetical protein